MVPGARGTAASEVVRAEASVGAEAWVLGESGAAKEESGAASAESETTSPARNAIGSPSLRHLRPNAGPRHHPLPSRPRSPGCHGSGRLSPQRSAATAPGQCRPLAPVPPGTMVTSTCLHLVGHISPSCHVGVPDEALHDAKTPRLVRRAVGGDERGQPPTPGPGRARPPRR